MGRTRTVNPFVRIDSESEQPKKLFLLACEGRHTERKYFEGVQKNKKKLRIVDYLEIEIFKKSHPDLSHPLRIFGELKEKVERLGIEAEEVCLIVDRDSDSFTEEQYTALLKGCEEQNYSIFLSNPNFELWLLFHFLDKKLSSEEMALFLSNSGEIGKSLQSILREKGSSRSSSFNKKILFEHYLDYVESAIKNAKLYEHEIEKLRDNLGTNVFKLLEVMLNS